MKQCLTSWILLPIACILASMYLTVPSPELRPDGSGGCEDPRITYRRAASSATS
jgi:hypothetical protein